MLFSKYLFPTAPAALFTEYLMQYLFFYILYHSVRDTKMIREGKQNDAVIKIFHYP